MRFGSFKMAAAAGIAAFGVTMGAVAGSPSAAAAQPQAKDPAQDLFVQRCSACHDPSTVTTQRHTGDEWREIVQRMIMNGAQLTDAEKETLVAFLAKNYGSGAQAAAPSAGAPAGAR